METNTLDNTCSMPNTGMEYSDSQMELYIKGNCNKIKEMVMHVRGRQMEISIMDSLRMIRSTEREYSLKKANYTLLNIKKESLSAKRNTDRAIRFVVNYAN